MVSFTCPKCKSKFSSKIGNTKDSFEQYGQHSKDIVEEGYHLKCPKCKNIYQIHLECIGKK